MAAAAKVSSHIGRRGCFFCRSVTSSTRVVEPWQGDASQGLPLSLASSGGLRLAKTNAWEYVRGAWFASQIMKRAPSLKVNSFGSEREPAIVDLFEALSVHRSLEGGAFAATVSVAR